MKECNLALSSRFFCSFCKNSGYPGFVPTVRMALKQLPKNSCSKDDFQLFGTNMNFQPSNDIPNPPDSRKKAVQHDKVAPRYEESFVQPEPPKKQKVIHPSHVSSLNLRSINPSIYFSATECNGGPFLAYNLGKRFSENIAKITDL